MSTRLAVIASAGAGVAALLWWRRRARRSSDSSTTRPVLCFGDSITEGYHGIWDHPEFGPKGKANCDELVHLRMHSYAIRLGALLARDAGAVSDASACDYSTALGFAEAADLYRMLGLGELSDASFAAIEPLTPARLLAVFPW